MDLARAEADNACKGPIRGKSIPLSTKRDRTNPQTSLCVRRDEHSPRPGHVETL
jgi:hypothetical protein